MKYMFLSIINWIVIHFGINPKNGGNPPNDRKFMIKKNFILKLLFIEIYSWFR